MKHLLIRSSLTMLFVLVLSFANAQSDEATTLTRSLNHFNDSLRYIDALNRIAMLSYEKSIDTTFVYTIRARAAADRLRYEKGKADALNNLGIVYDIKGNLQLALKYYDEANDIYRKLKDTANIVQTLMNIAMVYKEIGKDERAVQRFEAALENGRHLQKDSITALVIYNFLLQYPQRFNRLQARNAIKKARDIASRYQDERTMIAIDQLVADDLLDHGQQAAGFALLDSSIDRAHRKGLFYVSMDMLIDMGDRLATTAPAKAEAYYRRGLDLALSNGYLIYSRIMTRKLFELSASGKNGQKAALYGQQLIALNDEQEKLDNASGIDYLDYVVKDQQLKTLSIKSDYQATLLLLITILCLIALIAILLIRRSLLKTRKLNARIVEQNQQMRQTLGALEQSQADNTRMMQIVAHDLRNPISAITSAVSLMLENEPADDEREMLELILTSGNNSLALVNDLLQVNTHTADMVIQHIDLDRLLHYCVDLLKSKASGKKQQLTLQSMALIVPANQEKLWRVISNLIGNAIKFSPENSTITITLQKQNEHAVISVRDHGIGIPPELSSQIFDMFTKARRHGTAGEQPFGLGLAISKQIMEAHGGRIWYETPEDGGTIFWLELPLHGKTQ
ncbi:ATP-binding protein [Sediminibacterium ginsengisoli]|uniref:histidine kinase n=1 Tax=Sediminibacterium ginsengisoli TaxID=413434 RepID=A0A1T4R0T1_9BACT|nr:tetratricopeptide repeat-containing sensor histidine kinase [Sediminibacterium ginsengisoli]SKA09613.1 His Kinase A (phospho-acceptor) domain-containing protein [Sediminibacterium ginsengisoli]